VNLGTPLDSLTCGDVQALAGHATKWNAVGLNGRVSTKRARDSQMAEPAQRGLARTAPPGVFQQGPLHFSGRGTGESEMSG